MVHYESHADIHRHARCPAAADVEYEVFGESGDELPSPERIRSLLNTLAADGWNSESLVRDNLTLERWFRLPKSHERQIHGHRQAGVRIVQEGPTLVLALDAQVAHPGRFTAEELLPYRTAREPPCQWEALNRRKTRRKG